MSRSIKISILVLLAFLSSQSYAQERFSTFESSYFERKHDVLIAGGWNHNYTLWVMGMPSDELPQRGGIIVREKSHTRFIDVIEQAKQQYEKWVQEAKEKNVSKLYRSMQISCNMDVFLYDGTWNTLYNMPLTFDFSIRKKKDQLCYLLFIGTGDLISRSSQTLKSNSFNIALSSIEEIDKFQEAISTKRVKDFIVQKDSAGLAATKRKEEQYRKSVERNPIMAKIAYGFKVGFDAALGMNDVNSGRWGAYVSNNISSNLSSGYKIGVFGRIHFNKLFLQPELLYLMGQKSYSFSFMNADLQSIELNKKVRVRTIDLPLLFGYKVVGSNHLSLRILAGPKLRMNVGSTSEYTYFITLGENTVGDLTTKINSPQLGYEAGLEFDISSFTLGVRYHSIKDMYPTQFNSRTIDNISANSIAVSLGWKLYQPLK